MIVGVGLPALALEAAELASDEADVGEIDVAIDDVGDFIADVFGAGQIGALDRRAQVVAVGGVEQQSFFGRQFLALAAPFERRADGGTRLIHQRTEWRRFNLVNIIAQQFQVHDAPPSISVACRASAGRSFGSTQ